eukprot:TRINITY_DN12884_c0_g1_i1.p1 TRINITY_DN12884_c0_g1~~TRINITY_DN12884_c0_g1_i1.p1  ORF type:complete len:368 (+),score=47.25 TRINITY_DN12884_c0_g1_i1:68-1171(+)
MWLDTTWSVFESVELMSHVAEYLFFRDLVRTGPVAKLLWRPMEVACKRRDVDVYVFGGENSGSDVHDVQILDSSERLQLGAEPERWEAMPVLRQRRTGAVGAALGGCIYVCGGSYCPDDNAVGQMHALPRSLLRSVERFDPSRGIWEGMPDMLSHRCGAVAGVLKGKMYVCGGESGECGEYILSSVEVYNPTANDWSETSAMEGHRFAAAGAVLDGAIYVCGGSIGLDALSSVECYEHIGALCAWRCLRPMHEARMASQMAAVDGKLYVYGGASVERTHGSMERYDPRHNVWELVNAPASSRRSLQHAATLPGKACMLVFGGQEGTWSGAVRSCNVLEMQSQSQHRTLRLPQMLQARSAAVAVQLPR